MRDICVQVYCSTLLSIILNYSFLFSLSHRVFSTFRVHRRCFLQLIPKIIQKISVLLMDIHINNLQLLYSYCLLILNHTIFCPSTLTTRHGCRQLLHIIIGRRNSCQNIMSHIVNLLNLYLIIILVLLILKYYLTNCQQNLHAIRFDFFEFRFFAVVGL